VYFSPIFCFIWNWFGKPVQLRSIPRHSFLRFV